MSRLKKLLSIVTTFIVEDIFRSLLVLLLVSLGVSISLSDFWHALPEVLMLPTPLWATIGLVVAAYLLLRIAISHVSIGPKQVKPDLSQLDGDQEKVLASLGILPEATAENISTAINANNEYVIHILEVLRDKVLASSVHNSSVYETGWRLTKHGRKYLCERGLLNHP